MSEFRDLFIDSSATVRDAFEHLNRTARGILMLVDEQDRFLRTITDGDLRRLLLHDGTLDSLLEQLPKHESVVVPDGASPEAISAVMTDRAVRAVPVIGADGQVVDLALQDELTKPILLSVPHMSEYERSYVTEAFESNWVAPLGPNVTGFENEIAEKTGTGHAAALSSGTAALHLALVILGVERGDRVYCPSLTFVASVNPVLYQGAEPVLIDSEPGSWNMSPTLLEATLARDASQGHLPKAVVVVNLYGYSAEFNEISEICRRYDLPIVEDAAESLGATYHGRNSGTFGDISVFSFNGNKIITTSGGGMLVSANERYVERARWLSTQAKDDAPYYLHSVVGYNYRMSNVLAGIGRGQLRVLDDRVNQRRAIYQTYRDALSDFEQIEWIDEPPGTRPTHWLSVMLLAKDAGLDAQTLIGRLGDDGIEARRVWNPLHRHPLFAEFEFLPHADGSVADDLFERGICLPSSSSLAKTQQDRVIASIERALRRK